MKKVLLLLSVYASILSYGQLQNTTAPTDVFIHYRVNSKNGKQLSYDDIKGSPYLIRDFRLANIGANYENISARYNAYTDEIEFKKNDNIYVLPKNNNFSQIVFLNSTDKLIFLTADNVASGYYYDLVEGKNSLLKKEKVTFIDIIPSASSYEGDKPAKFQLQMPVYYIKKENESPKKILNKNDIYDLFPNKKNSLEIFFKKKKTKFSKENDLIELVKFLNLNN